MGLLNKRNIYKLKYMPYHFNGDIDKLNTGDLCVRKTGDIKVVIKDGFVTEFDFFNISVSYKDFWLVAAGPEEIYYGNFDYYKDYPDFEIDSVYPNAFTEKEIKEFTKMNKEEFFSFVKDRYNNIKQYGTAQ